MREISNTVGGSRKPLLKRDKLGRFRKARGWSLSNGYPRYSSGPHKGKYVHRVVVERSLGRKLEKDEQIHHRDRNKLNFRLRNLQVLSSTEHGWVSIRQWWFMNHRDQIEKKEWDKYFDEGATER